METIKFSIIIPVYNSQLYLKECIESVLVQSYKNFEIILINDGSTDSSGILCDNYANLDNRIKVIHQSNSGQLVARKNGVLYSTGDYCLFLDSDDYIDKNTLEKISNIVEKYNIDIIVFRFRKIDNNGKVIYESKKLFDNEKIFTNINKEELFYIIARSNDMNHLANKIIRRTLFSFDNFDYSEKSKIRNGEDLLQLLPLLYYSNSIIFIDDVLYNYRTNPNSITNTINRNFINDITLVRYEVLNYIKKYQNLHLKNYNIDIEFYEFYIRSILNYIIKLLKVKMAYKDFYSILCQLEKNILFDNSLKYKSKFKLNLKNKYILLFASKKKYKILYRISWLYNILKLFKMYDKGRFK